MRKIDRATVVIASGFAALVIGAFANDIMAACGYAELNCVSHRLKASQHPDHVLVFPSKTVTLTGSSTSTVTATDIGTSTPTAGAIPIAGTDSRIDIGWLPTSVVTGTATSDGKVAVVEGDVPDYLYAKHEVGLGLDQTVTGTAPDQSLKVWVSKPTMGDAKCVFTAGGVETGNPFYGWTETFSGSGIWDRDSTGDIPSASVDGCSVSEGQELDNGDRLLVYHSAPSGGNARELGIYTIVDKGWYYQDEYNPHVASTARLARASDNDTASEFLVGSKTWILYGDTYKGYGFSLLTAPTTLETDPVEYSLIREAPIDESKMLISDVTTWNVSTGSHGFVPKATGDTDKYLRADGTWSTVSYTGTSTSTSTAWNTAYEVDFTTLSEFTWTGTATLTSTSIDSNTITMYRPSGSMGIKTSTDTSTSAASGLFITASGSGAHYDYTWTAPTFIFPFSELSSDLKETVASEVYVRTLVSREAEPSINLERLKTGVIIPSPSVATGFPLGYQCWYGTTHHYYNSHKYQEGEFKATTGAINEMRTRSTADQNLQNVFDVGIHGSSIFTAYSSTSAVNSWPALSTITVSGRALDCSWGPDGYRAASPGAHSPNGEYGNGYSLRSFGVYFLYAPEGSATSRTVYLKRLQVLWR